MQFNTLIWSELGMEARHRNESGLINANFVPFLRLVGLGKVSFEN
jgi:hypothetical protein